MSTEPISLSRTQQSLEQTRAKQQATLRWLRLSPYALLALIIIASLRSPPRPGLEQAQPATFLALACLGIALLSSRGNWALPRWALIATLTLLILSSAAIVWLRPNSFGFLGMFIAVTVAAMRLHGRAGAGIMLLALIAIGGSQALATRSQVLPIAGNEIGLIAFYILGVLGYRLFQGQELAERLIAELEANRGAQAQAAVLAERTRLAREMHDVLAHSLSGLALQLAGAQLLAAQRNADPEIVTAIERTHHLARTGLIEARRAIGMLREDALPSPERLGELARDFEQDTGVPCALTIDGDAIELSSEARLTLYRVAQEALTNVRRHAAAHRVQVRLRYEHDGTCMSIEDFGRPPQAPTEANGYGLTGMRERAELLGGHLAAGPTDTGFRVELWLPA